MKMCYQLTFLILLYNILTLAVQTNSQNHHDNFSFTSPFYEATVPEISVTGSSIVESKTMMGMWLTDFTATVQYSVVGQNSHFKIRKRIEGNFVFLELQARSLKKDSNVRIKAVSNDGTHETFCTVKVKLLDINDLQPLFPSVPYYVEIDENIKIGTTIFYAQATDSDKDIENKRFYYSFPDFTNNFAINPTTGAVTVTAPINYDYQSEHVLRIQVTDRKAALAGNEQPKYTTLTIWVKTVNTYAPSITVRTPLDYLSSEVANGKRRIFTTLKIEDLDKGSHGQIKEPRIIYSEINHLFELEPISENEFSIVFRRDPPIKNAVVNITIEVSDKGIPHKTSQVTIPVQLYDDRAFVPQFKLNPFTFFVSESSPMYTQLGFVDALILNLSKPQKCRYAIVGGNLNNVFEINFKTGLLTTRTSLSRNVKSQYKLVISATNVNILSGNGRNETTVIVNVLDSNDHDPIFNITSYTASVEENAPIGSFVVQVSAYDTDIGNNGSIVYSLTDDSPLFKINPYNGSIYTKQLLDYDAMSTKSHIMKVRASDLGTPYSRESECLVEVRVLDKNDNAPKFHIQNCTVSLPKSTMVETEIVQLGLFDADRNAVSCSILSGDTTTFKIKSNTCALQVNSTLDNFSIKKIFTLQVGATDGKLTSKPVTLYITLTSHGAIGSVCQNTGEFSRYQEILNNNLVRPKIIKNQFVQFNRSSDLPNLFSPKVLNYKEIRTITLPENTPLNAVIATINAFDKDRGYNGELWYTITGGNDDSCFLICSQSGLIRLVLPLDRERQDSYNLTISVSDMGSPIKAKNFRIWITVSDVNDCPPTFDQSLYEFNIPENVSIGYTIQRKIWAYDRDQEQNAQIHYKISVGGNKFFINPVTGLINVTGKLDREEVADYKLVVTATDGSKTAPLSSTATVLIHVDDVNDNIPKFFQNFYRIRISEDLPVETLIFFLKAYDPDFGANGDVRYSLTDVRNKRDSVSRFKIDDRTGAIRLAAPLDYRTKSLYNITARARDVNQRHLFSTCYIEVQILPVNRNLFAPFFEERTNIRMEIAENAMIGSLVGSVSAVDEDTTERESDIQYSLVDGTGLGYFVIEPATGAITTSQGLDKESQQYYWLTVVAEDQASVPLSGHVFVLVEVSDVNDNAPLSIKPIYFASIEENCPLGSVVTTIEAFDKDTDLNTEITYTTSSNFFKINSITGVVTTKKRKIDRETAKTRTDLTFEVLITDSGNPPLSSTTKVVVELLDQNDNEPRFIEDLDSTLNLPERARTPVFLPVARVVAHDKDAGKNSNVTYRLKDSNGRFFINAHTGVISTKSAFQEGFTKVIKVMAFDQGIPQKHSRYNRVTISWGKRATKSKLSPNFLNMPESRPEMYFEHVDAGYKPTNKSSRFIKLMEASDLDSDQVWYYIANGNEDYMFHINSNDGSLFVTGDPDAEKTSYYNLTIEVSDGYNSEFTDVGISIGDVNDHRPQFSQEIYIVSIDENVPPNTEILQLNTTDKDLEPRNKNFKYSIRQSSNPKSLNKFRITSSGAIYTTSTLDREVNKEHILIVEVSDQGFPGALENYCRVIITVFDLNDHAPVFTSSTYKAQVVTGVSDEQLGTDDTLEMVVLRVKATDIDRGENARVLYSIASGNEDRLWKINPSSGEISATRRIVGNKGGAISLSTFLVRASDCARIPLSSTAEVRIEIVTRFDFPPVFANKFITIGVNENVHIGSYITTVTATAPSGITYNITSGNLGSKFFINAFSGVLTLVNTLDRETNDSYNLFVTAVNADGKASTMNLVITVLDANDNRPNFNKYNYLGSVSENQGNTGSFLVTNSKGGPLVINAHDHDIGDNSRLVYSLVNPATTIKQRFAIDGNIGVIQPLQGVGLFDYETAKQYSFEVQVMDSGEPQLSSIRNAMVTIAVVANNYSPPIFTQSSYELIVFLPTAPGVIISRHTYVDDTDFIRRKGTSLIYTISGQNDGNALSINSTSGTLSVNNPDTLQEGDQFLLRIRASDGNRSSIAICDITVKNLPSNNLFTFSQLSYEAVIFENVDEIQFIAFIQVLGTTINDFLRYSILNSNPYFYIHPTTGLIETTGKPVDRELHLKFKLLIEVVDVHSTDADNNILRRGRVIVSVSVKDVNDNAPYLVGLPYLATVQVDAKPDTVVKQVQAIDADIGLNKEIRYSLTGEYSDIFNINDLNGVVTLSRTPSEHLSNENTKFNLTVLASDLGHPKLQGFAVLQILIVNRATPVFTEQFYGNILLPEDAQPHSVVFSNIFASNPENSNICYSIISGDPMHKFDIDFLSGTLITLGNLDYEQTKQYQLQVRARNAQSHAYADVKVVVNIIDVNDNWPIFSKPKYEATLSELARVGNQVIQVFATDVDSESNGYVRYSIVESTDSGYFYIDPTTGLILTTRNLDAETKQNLSVVIRASDGGKPAKYSSVSVNLFVSDVNDNFPIFEEMEYEFSISVNSEKDKFVGKVQAFDSDKLDRNNLYYGMENTMGLLQINSKTGVITTTVIITPDLPKNVISNVSVSDGIYSSSSGIIIHIIAEDVFPIPVEFVHNIYNFSVSEGSSSSFNLGQVQATGTGTLEYRISSIDYFSQLFIINALSGNLFTNAPINRETLLNKLLNQTDNVVATIFVQAQDQRGVIGNCMVNIYIKDVNNNAPRFTQSLYKAYISLKQVVNNQHVLKITASDQDSGENGRVTYLWGEDVSNAKQFFRLNDQTGDIFIREIPRKLGNVEKYSFYILAKDNGPTKTQDISSVSVSILLTTNSDLFLHFTNLSYTAYIREDATVGSSVVTVHAFNDDENNIKYKIAQPTATKENLVDVPFAINPISGKLTTSSSIDRESTNIWNLTILAYVDTSPQLVTSTLVSINVIDMNDNSPQFTSDRYEASIIENLPKHTEVIQVFAVDFDLDKAGTVAYSLKPSEPFKIFAIDNKTGVITTTKSLDHEKLRSYEITVIASDEGQPSMTAETTVIIHVIDVNDCEPQFLKSKYHISFSESSAVGVQSTMFLRVTDNDTIDVSNIAFYITKGNNAVVFKVVSKQVNENENIWTAGLELLKPLDRETQQSYNLTILVTDGLFTQQTRVIVKVSDANDNTPTCSQLSYYVSIPENSQQNSEILRIKSYDPDYGSNSNLKYAILGDDSNAFTINSNSGIIFTSSSLNREVKDMYRFTTFITDVDGLYCTSEVTVKVSDINDNAPVFDLSSLKASPRENTPINSLLHRVIALDKDLGNNGTFTLALVDDIDGHFYIEPNTGVIVLKQALDREKKSSYDLEILATDNGQPRRSSSATLHLTVLDVNDNPPVFDQNQYESHISEDVQPGVVVSQVNAKSIDTGNNADLIYSLIHGNEHGKFIIHRDSGEVRLVSSVDFESDQSFVLTISASDRSDNPLSAECTLKLIIDDVNDNSPEFTENPYQISILEDANVGQVLATVTAIDLDSGEFGNITYKIISTQNLLPLSINAVSGEISIISPGLNFEDKSFYNIQVTATDKGKPPRESKASVLINVEDINDNGPQILLKSPPNNEGVITCSPDGANCTVYVHEGTNKPVVDGIVLLNSSDSDGPDNSGPFKYRIASGNHAGIFYIDPETKILKTKHSLRLSDLRSQFSRNNKQVVHRITISSEDSGILFSMTSRPDLTLNVVVLKESQYAPQVTPHRIGVSVYSSKFFKGNISSKLYASDRDHFDKDRLRFSLSEPDDFENFAVYPTTGAISAQTYLSVGDHDVTVRVSDGSRSTLSTVQISVTEITDEILKQSVSISFDAIESEAIYLSLYHTLFVDKLANILPDGFNQLRDFIVISLQTNNMNSVELLFSIRKPPSAKAPFYESMALRGILENSQSLIEEKLRINVSNIKGIICDQNNCQYGICQQIPNILPENFDNPIQPVSTNTLSLLTPHFNRNEQCVCALGKSGPICKSICSQKYNPCSRSKTCSLDEGEKTGYTCDSDSDTVMAFSGQAFAQYVIPSKTPLHVSLRIRSFQSNGTVFKASGTQNFVRLDIANGLLKCTFDCGSGIQIIVLDLQRVNDGKWHDVDIQHEDNNCAFKLILDNRFVASAQALSDGNKLNLTTFTVGGFLSKNRQSRSISSRSKRNAVGNLLRGFRGCLQDVVLNGEPLPNAAQRFPKSTASGISMKYNNKVVSRCRNKILDMGACVTSPCINGGICLPDAGSYRCECLPTYMGENCEIANPCGTLPCQNEGVCLGFGNDFRCDCKDGFNGAFCQTPPSCQNHNHCFNGGSCKIGACDCLPTWTGLNCEIDVDECTRKVNGQSVCAEECFNYDGGFACNCRDKIANVDSRCKFVNSTILRINSAKSPVGVVVAISVVIIVILVVVIVGILCWRRRRKSKYKQGSNVPLAPVHSFNPDNYHIPAQTPVVPERPDIYHPSSRDSFNYDGIIVQERPPVVLVRPQAHPLPVITPSASDNDSIKKPPSSWHEYDLKNFNESTSSSFRNHKPDHNFSNLSIHDQQSYDWDVTDLRPIGGSGMVSPSVAHVNGRQMPGGSISDMPSSPESRRSISSYATGRSRRSNRSNALQGYYSKSAKRRQQKQMMQMVEYNMHDPQSRKRLQNQLSYCISQGTAPENVSTGYNSQGSSIQSSASRYRPSISSHGLTSPPLHPPYQNDVLLPSNPRNGAEFNQTPRVDSPRECLTSDGPKSSSSSAKPSDSDTVSISSNLDQLPPPPREYELQSLQEEQSDVINSHLPPSFSSYSHTSLFETPYDVNLPTPSVARSTRFHPDQYLVSYLSSHTSDMSEGESVLGSPNGVKSLHRSVLRPEDLQFTPAPPVRMDSERLEMSSLSEEEEDAALLDQHKKLPKRKQAGLRSQTTKLYGNRRQKKTKRNSSVNTKAVPLEISEKKLVNNKTENDEFFA